MKIDWHDFNAGQLKHVFSEKYNCSLRLVYTIHMCFPRFWIRSRTFSTKRIVKAITATSIRSVLLKKVIFVLCNHRRDWRLHGIVVHVCLMIFRKCCVIHRGFSDYTNIDFLGKLICPKGMFNNKHFGIYYNGILPSCYKNLSMTKNTCSYSCIDVKYLCASLRRTCGRLIA